MTEKLPIVIYTFRGLSQETGDRAEGFGYLVKRGNDYWCDPIEDTPESQTVPSGSFQLDLSQLREQPNTKFDRKLYRYLLEVETSHPGSPVLPPQSGFQPKVSDQYPIGRKKDHQ